MEAQYVKDEGVLDFIASDIVASAEVRKMPDGRAGVAQGLQAKAIGDAVGYAVEGQFRLASASATTFAAGDQVFWDLSGNVAIPASQAIAEDFYVGPAVVAKIATELDVQVDLNILPRANGPTAFLGVPLQPTVYEFDCQTGVDTAVHTLIPAAQNPRGLIIMGVYGIITEVFAGTEDQGVVTIKDTADTPATIGTLTPSDGGADAQYDVIVGTGGIFGASTGAAAKIVAAGKGVTGQVTTVTTGSAAGKVKVYILAVPLA